MVLVKSLLHFLEYQGQRKIIQITPPDIPHVITASIVTRERGVRIALSKVSPIACVAASAAIASYERFPTTLKRSHDTGTPKLPDSAITPNKMEIDGRIVNRADDVIVLFNRFFSIPIFTPAL